MDVMVCIGSSCYLKGSKDIISILQKLIEHNGLNEKVNLAGSFCMGHCMEGVCVKVDGNLFSVTPSSTEEFFNKNILGGIE